MRAAPATHTASNKRPAIAAVTMLVLAAVPGEALGAQRIERASPKLPTSHDAAAEPIASATVLRAAAHIKYSKRDRCAYGHDRSRVGAPDRTSSTKSPMPCTIRPHTDAPCPKHTLDLLRLNLVNPKRLHTVERKWT